jgi:C_GCAxxG_C_C family probable redox protein
MSIHSEKANELFEKGYNCSQSVFAAFCDKTGLDSESALKISSSFGGGMGRLREVCGAVSGMFMAVGMIYGYTDPKDNTGKMELYKLIQELAERFKAENRSIICRELLKQSGGQHNRALDDTQKDRAGKRSCGELVEFAAALLDEYIEADNKEKQIQA